MTDNVQPDPGPDDDALALAHTLFQAAREGDTALLRAYLDAGAPATLTNSAGDSLLMLAAYHGHAETVQVILAYGHTAPSPAPPMTAARLRSREPPSRATPMWPGSCWMPAPTPMPERRRPAPPPKCSPARRSWTSWPRRDPAVHPGPARQ